jgi:predicted acetyltransferase
MKLSVIKADSSKKYIIKNLYPLYLHDMAEIWDMKPNQHGIFEDDDSKNLEEQFSHFDIWWSDESIFYPYLIYKDGVPVGFALAAKAPYTPKECDICLHEFFILRPYRTQGLGKAAAEMVFNAFPGTWCFYTNPTSRNQKAQRFWRSFLASYTGGKYQKTHETTSSDTEVLAFRFEVKA